MNAEDILKYGNQTFLDALQKFPADHLADPGACGFWSVKDLVSHLASHEQFLVEVLSGLTGITGLTPYMNALGKLGPEQYNLSEVEKRKDHSYEAVLAEYSEAHEKVMGLLKQIPVEKRQENGILPWYGSEYSLEDFLVYGYYGHKREHSAHIGSFQDSLNKF